MFQQRRVIEEKPTTWSKLPTPLTEIQLLKVWEELFYQLISQESPQIQQTCIQLLITQHYLVNNATVKLADLIKMCIVIPKEMIAQIQFHRQNKGQSSLKGVTNLGIADHRCVEQELSRYAVSEVSHIENIMAKEYKEKHTRNLVRTELSTEISQEFESEMANDTATTNRNELSTEIAKELQKDRAFDVSGSVSVAKKGVIFPSFSANVNSGFASNMASTQSNLEAKNFAQEIVENAVERVVQKTTERRSFKMLQEFEENNKHGYDNRNGEKHVTGVFRWLDKVYTNRLVNTGKRLMLEIMVPEPSLIYKKAVLWHAKQNEGVKTTLPTAPETLASFNIQKPADIVQNNAKLQAAAAYFGLIVSFPEQQKTKNFHLVYSNLGFKDLTEFTDVHTEEVEAGYQATRLWGNFTASFQTNASAVVSVLHFGNNLDGSSGYLGAGTSRIFNFDSMLTPALEGNLDLHFSFKKVGSLDASLSLQMQLTTQGLESWQNQMYQAFLNAYQNKKRQYEEELRLHQTIQQVYSNNNAATNPAQNRLVEERELKRLSVEMMSRPFGYTTGANFYTNPTVTNAFDAPNVTQNAQLQWQAELVKFFEHAFEWKKMAYTFYPYYYNPKSTWADLIPIHNDDPIFQAFLQSGMAKILVSVRPQFEESVMYYLETGDIWMGGDLIPETQTDHYQSLMHDLQQPKSTIEETWETRVPTTLTLIQGKSVYLDQAGLPTFTEENEQNPDAPLLSADNTLQIKV